MTSTTSQITTSPAAILNSCKYGYSSRGVHFNKPLIQVDLVTYYLYLDSIQPDSLRSPSLNSIQFRFSFQLLELLANCEFNGINLVC